MKIKAIRLLFFSMFVVSTVAPAWAGENLVRNPGFESGVGLLSGWLSKTPLHLSSDNKTFRSGRKSLKLTVEDSEKYVLVGQKVPVTPGESYDIGAWIKTQTLTGPGAQVCIEWSGKKGWLGGEWNAAQVKGTQGWKFTGVERVKIPEEATSATVYLRLIKGSTGTAWFDDIVVRKKKMPLMRSFVLRPSYRGRILPGAASPEIAVEITLNPKEHGLALNQLEVRLGLSKAAGDTIAQKAFDRLSSNKSKVTLDIAGDTKPGEYTLAVSLFKAANLLAEDTYEIEKLSQKGLSVLTSYIDEHNRFILNGKPFFPLGLYMVQGLADTSQLDEIAASPFDTLMNYNVNNGTDRQITSYLNELWSRNLKLIYSLNEYIGKGEQDIYTITHKVNNFGNHPAVIAWYMNDEMGLEYLPELEARYQKIKELDRNHPVWTVNMRKYVLVEEAHTTDILGVDPYPIPTSPITRVSEWADWAKDAGRGYRPLWLVPQIFNWADYASDPRSATGRAPTRDEMRAMTYLAINHNAKGLIYYSYFNIRDNADYKTRWEEIKELAREIDRLRPVLLSTQQVDNNQIVCNHKDIDFNLMKEDNTYYLFAVNTKKDAFSGVLFKPGMTNRLSRIDVLFESGRQVAVDNGSFKDDFGPYEVHVYYWKGL